MATTDASAVVSVMSDDRSTRDRFRRVVGEIVGRAHAASFWATTPQLAPPHQPAPAILDVDNRSPQDRAWLSRLLPFTPSEAPGDRPGRLLPDDAKGMRSEVG
jgi:hypothetical protein